MTSAEKLDGTPSQLLTTAFPDAQIHVDDLAGDGDHYRARIVSTAFRGLSRIKQHQLVYSALKGNEVARHSDPVDASREGVMPRFTFTETAPGHWEVTTAEAVPTWVDLTPAIRIGGSPASA